MKTKTLRQYITDAKKNGYFTHAENAFSAICVAFPETDMHGDCIDLIAWSMQCDNCGETVFYTWVEYDGKITGRSRQTVKYGIYPGSYDGQDLKPYITKYGRKYWLDDFIRMEGQKR